MTSTISFNVNGKDITFDITDPETSLATYLRNTLGLTGTKLACGEGACGSCTVVIGKWNKKENKAKYRAVNACIFPLFLADRCFIITVEGIGSPKKIHVIQDRLARGHGAQCGFCSPGFVMSAYALLRNTPNPTIKQINQAVKGNLCRCTGYRPILEALYSFSSEGCCQGKNGSGCPCKEKKTEKKGKLISFDDFPKLDESQELIFPPSLLKDQQPTIVFECQGPRVHLIMPTSLAEVLKTKEKNPKARIISTGMITRLASNEKGRLEETWICTARVAELHEIQCNDSVVSVGSAHSITDLLSAVKKNCDTSISKPLEKVFDKYSSMQTMNIASWAGSLCQSNRPSDLCSFVLALNLQLQVFIDGKEKKITAEEFLEKKHSEEIILKHIEIPKSTECTIIPFKAGMRPGADSTIVNSVAVFREKDVIKHASIVFGIQNKPIKARKLEKYMKNRKSSELFGKLEKLYGCLEEDLSSFEKHPDFPFLLGLSKAAVFQFVCQISGHNQEGDCESEQRMESTQIFKPVSDSQSPGDGVGRPLAHLFADRTTTGEAVFVGDIPIKDLVHMGYVLSTEASADILSVDPSEALAQEGVLGYFDVKDVKNNTPGAEPFNAFEDNTPLFANGKVESIGQPIGAIAATSVEIARRAASLVKVEYRKTPAILKLEDAIKNNKYLADPVVYGADEKEIEEKLKHSEKILEGEIRVGGQEHMYMEPQSAIVVPGESDEFVIHSSTQTICEVQLKTAAVLGIPANKVVAKNKRVGGAFGGKLSWSLFPAATAAIAANRLRRPVSAVLSREEDCNITGKRHPGLVKYRLGLSKDGYITALHLKSHLDGGYSNDHSPSVTWVTAAMADGALFKFDALRSEGFAMKTNKTSNTAFRGYGSPQATFVMECIMHRVAHETQTTIEKVKEKHFNPPGGTTLLGRRIHNEAMQDCWNEVHIWSKFEQRKEEIEKFNSASNFTKRGIAISSVRFGLTHPGSMEQATALVQIYLDGTVAVSVGAVEMGQGVASKCQQVASRALGVPISQISILEASTEKTANIPETAGSISADMHGRAIMAACDRLLIGLKPILEKGKTWNEAIVEAWNSKLPLQATEQIKIDRASYGYQEDWSTYFTTGAACVEAEVNCITGDHKLRSVEIVMDVGESLNPAVDIGQIEGAFMQGYGLLSCEDLKWDETGKLETNTLNKYKIPTAAMVPEKFNIQLLGEAPNYPGQVYSSKGIGEPPLMLGAAAYSAIRGAIMAHRTQMGQPQWVQIDAPLTRRRILEFCQGPATKVLEN